MAETPKSIRMDTPTVSLNSINKATGPAYNQGISKMSDTSHPAFNQGISRMSDTSHPAYNQGISKIKLESNTIEQMNLDNLNEIPNEGKIQTIDLTKISTSAKGALNNDFINEEKLNKPIWETKELLYKIRDDGAVAIIHEGMVIGFTTKEAIGVEEVKVETSRPAFNQGISRMSDTSHPAYNQGISGMSDTSHPAYNQGISGMGDTSHPTYNQGISSIKTEVTNKPDEILNTTVNKEANMADAISDVRIHNEDTLNYTPSAAKNINFFDNPYGYNKEQMELIFAIVQREAGTKDVYVSALAVISSAFNRMDNDWSRDHFGNDPLSQLTAENQYCYSIDGMHQKFVDNPELVDIEVKKAVYDAMRGVRNHNYMYFNYFPPGDKEVEKIGGNYFW